MAGDPSPPLLTTSKLTWCPLAVEISTLVFAGLAVSTLTNNNWGSRSECSTSKSAGSPTATDDMASGSRMAVTKCAATSTVVTWVAMSGRGTIRGWGSAVCACAQAAKAINATVQNAWVMTYLLVWFGYAASGTGGQGC